MADKAKQTVDQLVRTMQVVDEQNRKNEAARRADPTSKEAITAYLNSLNGAVNLGMSRSAICHDAGVLFNQGNSGFARREILRITQSRDMKASAST